MALSTITSATLIVSHLASTRPTTAKRCWPVTLCSPHLPARRPSAGLRPVLACGLVRRARLEPERAGALRVQRHAHGRRSDLRNPDHLSSRPGCHSCRQAAQAIGRLSAVQDQELFRRTSVPKLPARGSQRQGVRGRNWTGRSRVDVPGMQDGHREHHLQAVRYEPSKPLYDIAARRDLVRRPNEAVRVRPHHGATTGCCADFLSEDVGTRSAVQGKRPRASPRPSNAPTSWPATKAGTS